MALGVVAMIDATAKSVGSFALILIVSSPLKIELGLVLGLKNIFI
tara:strand:- start:66518 stop:66652 length:135 start_codon:yes stop_codon:yes gene_type:complete